MVMCLFLGISELFWGLVRVRKNNVKCVYHHGGELRLEVELHFGSGIWQPTMHATDAESHLQCHRPNGASRNKRNLHRIDH